MSRASACPPRFHSPPPSVKVSGIQVSSQLDTTHENLQAGGEMLTAVRNYVSGIFWHFGLT